MYERLKRLYKEGRITEEGLQYWVDKGVITPEQKQEIIISKWVTAIQDGESTIDECPVAIRDIVRINLGIE